MPGSCVLSYPSPGVEAWGINLDPTHVYTGAQLAAVANYCVTNNLKLSAQFSALGIV